MTNPTSLGIGIVLAFLTPGEVGSDGSSPSADEFSSGDKPSSSSPASSGGDPDALRHADRA